MLEELNPEFEEVDRRKIYLFDLQEAFRQLRVRETEECKLIISSGSEECFDVYELYQYYLLNCDKVLSKTLVDDVCYELVRFNGIKMLLITCESKSKDKEHYILLEKENENEII